MLLAPVKLCVGTGGTLYYWHQWNVLALLQFCPGIGGTRSVGTSSSLEMELFHWHIQTFLLSFRCFKHEANALYYRYKCLSVHSSCKTSLWESVQPASDQSQTDELIVKWNKLNQCLWLMGFTRNEIFRVSLHLRNNARIRSFVCRSRVGSWSVYCFFTFIVYEFVDCLRPCRCMITMIGSLLFTYNENYC